MFGREAAAEFGDDDVMVMLAAFMCKKDAAIVFQSIFMPRCASTLHEQRE